MTRVYSNPDRFSLDLDGRRRRVSQVAVLAERLMERAG